MSALSLAFFGTADFAVPTLEALGTAGHEIAAVYCQPPRRAGRGHRLQASPVQRAAEAGGWPVRTPSKLKSESEAAAFQALRLDAAVVAAYGLILPPAFLSAPRLGCFNVHASLLPRWRGAAPIHRAILAGDRETGISIMKMDEGLDSGPVYRQEALPIAPDMTAAGLHDRLAALGAQLMLEVLARFAVGENVPAKPQPADGVTYAAKLEKHEGRLDWRRPASELERRVRAFTPWPGAWFEIEAETIKVLRAAVRGDTGEPGEVLPGHGDGSMTIACGEGSLGLLELQRAGRRPMAAADFLRGFPLAEGTRLPCPATS
jgi:methionyl-tRNA formyltransferase